MTPLAKRAKIVADSLSESKIVERQLIYGTMESEHIVGTRGPDFILDLAGDDVVWGNLGADTFYNNRGNDRLFGEGGDDLLFIHPESATKMDPGRRVVFDGGAGFDTVDVYRGAEGFELVERGDKFVLKFEGDQMRIVLRDVEQISFTDDVWAL